ncbi:MAG: diaminopimelate epimerase [Solirubrobacterales bacterium]
MRFEKWTALGNDYLIVEAAALPWELSPDRIRRICDPHFGVGSDGILLLAPVEEPAYVAELRIFNPDGTETELSGNGAREAAIYLRHRGWTEADEFTILTKAGEIKPKIRSERDCTVGMGRASTRSPDFPSGGEDGRGELEAEGRRWSFQHVSIGNPQCAIEVAEGLEDLDLTTLGPEIEHHELFPNRTNVSFFHATGDRLRARIFERGVGETLASGTGACGAAVAALLSGAESPMTVNLDGGQLDVEVTDQLDVRLTGWAEPICAGELSERFTRGLAELR